MNCKILQKSIRLFILAGDSYAVLQKADLESQTLTNRVASQFYYSFMPLAGILLFGSSRRQRGRSVLLAFLYLLPVVITACGGGGRGGSSAGTNPELGTYTIQFKIPPRHNPTLSPLPLEV